MSTINTESLFHYASKISVLKKILKEGLKFTYCKETIGNLVLGIPMISFCDIPISRASEHKDTYGGFVLGLSKKSLLMGKTKDYLNPVMYLHSNGTMNGVLRLHKMVELHHAEMKKLIQNSSPFTIELPDNRQFNAIGSSAIDSHTAKKIFDNFGIEYNRDMLLGYSKPYISKGKNDRLVTNYYEREWRAVLPDFDKHKWQRNEDEHEQWRKPKDKPKKFLDLAITFSVEDINHILVPTEKDIPSLVKFITKTQLIGGEKILDEKQRILLTTKITSFERINSDY